MKKTKKKMATLKAPNPDLLRVHETLAYLISYLSRELGHESAILLLNKLNGVKKK